jgi:hypothetical protein
MKMSHLMLRLGVASVPVLFVSQVIGQQTPRQQTPPQPDAVQEAQTPRTVPAKRPEQNKTQHDQSNIFAVPAPSSPALEQQTDKGQEKGFVFARDPHDAMRPMQTFDDAMKAAVAERPGVSAAQRRLLESGTT